jgi:hypothetical protein
MDQTNPQEHRRAAVRGLRGRESLTVEWIVLPAAIAFVIVVGFGLKLLLG